MISMNSIQRKLCKIGIHKWVDSREIGEIETPIVSRSFKHFVPFYAPHERAILRCCVKCQKVQLDTGGVELGDRWENIENYTLEEDVSYFVNFVSRSQ